MLPHCNDRRRYGPRLCCLAWVGLGSARTGGQQVPPIQS